MGKPRKPCPSGVGRYKSGKKKGRCKSPHAGKKCACTTLPKCRAYLRRAYKAQRVAARKDQAKMLRHLAPRAGSGSKTAWN